MASYADLVADLQEWAENDDEEFIAEIPHIVEMVELELSRRLRHLDFYKSQAESTTIAGTSDYAKPSSNVTTLGLTANIGGKMVFIHERPQTFVDFYWPNLNATGSRPKYYAHISETEVRIVPTPNNAWPLIFAQTVRPEPLSPVNPMNWMTKNAYDVLFNLCMYYAEAYTKNTEKAQSWKAAADGLIVALGGEGVAQHEDEGSMQMPTPGR